ncbi:hypothetical protein BTHE_0433 [Bifidobacterium thermophilum]|nr:hypothetical protein BTHE_0433 [Bifidobacterium thermophilum]
MYLTPQEGHTTMCVSLLTNNMTAATTDTMTVKDAPASAATTTVGERRNRRANTTHFKPLMVSTQEACELLGLKDGGDHPRPYQSWEARGREAGQ